MPCRSRSLGSERQGAHRRPQTLQMMNDRLRWTELGDAFLAQQAEVLDAVQRLRARADKAGNLKSTSQQTVRRSIARPMCPPPAVPLRRRMRSSPPILINISCRSTTLQWCTARRHMPIIFRIIGTRRVGAVAGTDSEPACSPAQRSGEPSIGGTGACISIITGTTNSIAQTSRTGTGRTTSITVAGCPTTISG